MTYINLQFLMERGMTMN